MNPVVDSALVAPPGLPAPPAPPVEYAVAVDRFLAAAGLSAASQRVYRIALTTWAWMLVERESPMGASRRGAVAPVVPLGLVDSASAPARLAAGFAAREAAVGARTANRELAILRSALSWWRARGWVTADPTVAIRRRAAPSHGAEPLSEEQARAVLRLRAPLREQALWHAVYDSGGGIERILALDVPDLDPSGRRTRPTATGPALHWRPTTGQLLALLAAGRPSGPLFLTDRRAPTGTAPRDRCAVTGRGRLSYRRAAEVFGEATRGLDAGGRGWTLRQLRRG
jgi:integrase/recombinase XerD